MTTIPEWARHGREGWRHTGATRPPFAIEPRAGQESVWDYPRPPRLVPDAREVIVRVDDEIIARTTRAIRVLETASPPTFYLPPDDVRTDVLVAASGRSMCEWKGTARYWTVAFQGRTMESVAWSYPDPFPEFDEIRGYFSFYPARLECYVDGHRVEPQPGDFYGGWITPEVVGPFKGEHGTGGW